MNPWLQAMVVFCAAFAIDFAYTAWIRAVAAGSLLRAGFSSAAVGLLGYISLVATVHDIFMLIPDLAGLFLGSICGLLYARRGDNR